MGFHSKIQDEKAQCRFRKKTFETWDDDWDRKNLGFQSVQILVDRTTGVNYLFAYYGDVGGLTVLLDENGRPVITKEEG